MCICKKHVRHGAVLLSLHFCAVTMSVWTIYLNGFFLNVLKSELSIEQVFFFWPDSLCHSGILLPDLICSVHLNVASTHILCRAEWRAASGTHLIELWTLYRMAAICSSDCGTGGRWTDVSGGILVLYRPAMPKGTLCICIRHEGRRTNHWYLTTWDGNTLYSTVFFLYNLKYCFKEIITSYWCELLQQ